MVKPKLKYVCVYCSICEVEHKDQVCKWCAEQQGDIY